jgi:hypothetical protein
MTIIEQIREMCNRANPDYLFEHEEARMLNVKVDGVYRGESFVYLEEVQIGYYDMPRGRQRLKTIRMQLYFCKFIDMHAFADRGDMPLSVEKADTVTRQELRDLIEGEIVLPFIDEFDRAVDNGDFVRVTRFPFRYPPTRFDVNEVSVLLELEATIPLC